MNKPMDMSCWLVLVGTFAFAAAVRAAPIPVAIRVTGDGYRLERGGEPYLIRGVGGEDRLAELVQCGGNSIRTWDAREIGPFLDRAAALGVSVTVGFWLGHERHGFDYGNADAVYEQLERCRAFVETYKDHPAVLMWGVGNEMEGTGDDPAIWYAVNHIARLCKALDPNHPTMTVIAELGGAKVANLHRFCPDIDLVGINSYGGVNSVAQRYREAGGTKPIVITEFGPLGQWETGKTGWGAPEEMTSTEKAARYRDGYRSTVETHPELCLGSYAFLWGFKQEATATWFGMYLKDGSRLQAIEAMTEAWGGEPPTNHCPRISRVRVEKTDGLQPGQTFAASVEVSDPDRDPVEITWVLRLESGQYMTGGDAQPDQLEFPDAIVASADGSATVRVPEGVGSYRLFAYAHDGQGNAAVANQPLRVQGPPDRDRILLPPAEIPFVLYRDALDGMPYAPSGYMGNSGAIEMNGDCRESPAEGVHCLQVDYQAADGWGGVVWQSPAEDWGDAPGGYNLTGAAALTFQVRGQAGGEVVSFSLGLLGDDKPYPDSGGADRKDFHLTTDWQEVRIPLHGLDLSRIKTGFAWTVAGQGAPVTFFLDDVAYVP